MEKMVCTHCGKSFTYTEVTHVIEHVRQLEPVECPYCHRVTAKFDTNGYFVSKKVEGSNAR